MAKKTRTVSLKGANDVIKALGKKEKASGRALRIGMKQAGLHLQRLSQLKVPVEQGNLKQSAFTRDLSAGNKILIVVGFGASYAHYIHEQVQMKWKGKKRKGRRADGLSRKGRYWDPSGKGQAKFLEQPFKNNFPDLLRIIKKTIRKVMANE